MMKNFVLFFMIFLSSLPSLFAADCYRNCMSASGCWNSMGESENRSFCSGMQATCSTQCRHSSSGKAYGAIAYSTKTESYGYSDHWDNQKKAEKTAMKYCSESGPGCKVMVWFYDSCGAVAADGKKTGWGQDYSEGTARGSALKDCQKSGGKNCAVAASHCSK